MKAYREYARGEGVWDHYAFFLKINILFFITENLLYKGPFTIVNIFLLVQSVQRGGRGHDASVLILNVDILIMLPPGGYD